MKILIILNNHNSFSLLRFCKSLIEVSEQLQIISVCEKQFYEQNKVEFEYLGIKPLIFNSEATQTLNKNIAITTTATPLFQTAKQIIFNSLVTISSLIQNTSIYMFAREWRIRKKLKISKYWAEKIIENLQPNAIVSLSDRTHDYIESSILWAGKKHGIKILLGYSSHFDAKSSLGYRQTKNGEIRSEFLPFKNTNLYKILLYLKLKHTMLNGVFFQSPFILSAAAKEGTISSYPWSVGNGNCDLVCVDTNYTKNRYLQAGVDENKIKVIGHSDFDNVFASFKNKTAIKIDMYKKYRLEAGAKLITLSMPQFAEQGFLSWERHWEEIENILTKCSSKNLNTLVSLHPRSDRAKYEWIIDKYKLTIADEKLSDFIGASDLFIASNSTTITWAILCEIPSINTFSPTPSLYKDFSTVKDFTKKFDDDFVVERYLENCSKDFRADWDLLQRENIFQGRTKLNFLHLIQ